MNRLSSFLPGLVLLVLLAPSAFSQQRYDSGPWKGFQMGRPEGLPLTFAPIHCGANLNGSVNLEGKRAIAGVVVELRGPGGKTEVRAAKTDAGGHFAFHALADGTYQLKTTRDGFGSAVGTVEVSHSSKSEPVVLKIRYAM